MEPDARLDKQLVSIESVRHIVQQPSIEIPSSRQYQIQIRLILGLVLALLLLPVCLFFDLVVASNVNYQVVPGDLRTVLSCSEVFGHTYGVALLLVAIWLAAPQVRRQIQSIACLLAVNCVVIAVLKNSLMRTRPRSGQANQFASVWETFQGYNPAVTQLDFSQLGISNLQSYPSGHSATAFILGIGLAITFPRARYILLLFALLACGQRIGFQAHYLSDVCAGVVVALVLFFFYLMTPYGKRSLLGEELVFPVISEWPKEENSEIARAA